MTQQPKERFGIVLPLPKYVAWRQRGAWGWDAAGSSGSREDLRSRFPDLLILPYRERPMTRRPLPPDAGEEGGE